MASPISGPHRRTSEMWRQPSQWQVTNWFQVSAHFLLMCSPFHLVNLSLVTVITNKRTNKNKQYQLHRACKLLAMKQKLRSAHCTNVSITQRHEETLTIFSLAITVASNPLSQGVIVVQQRRVSMVMVVSERTTCLLLCHWTDASSRGGQAELRLVRRRSSQRGVRHHSSLKTGNTGFQLVAEQFSAVMRNWVLKQFERNLN